MKKVTLLLVIMMLVFSGMAFAESFPPTIKAPSNVILSDVSNEPINGASNTNFYLQVNYSVDEMINRMQYDYEDKGEEAFWSQYGKNYDGSTFEFKTQLDWKIDDGKWISERVNAIPAWDRGESAKDNANCQWEYQDLSIYSAEIQQNHEIFSLGYEGDYAWDAEDDPEWGWKNKLPSDIFKWVTDADGYRHPYIDLENHTVTVRVRTLLKYSIEYGDYEYLHSDWSKEASIGGKSVGVTRPTILSKPIISNLTVERVNEVGHIDYNQPYLVFNMIVPSDVTEAGTIANALNDRLTFRAEISVNGGAYTQLYNLYAQGLGRFELNDGKYEQYFETDWITENGYTVESLQEAKIDYKIRYEYSNWDTDEIYAKSDWSKISIGRDAWSNASKWATIELQEANNLGLIPDVLTGQDLTKSITRAEFAAVSVKVYEALSGTKALPNTVNPFTDTNDVEILKAYNLGITNGVSADKFDPNALLNREQASTMLTRTFKRATMNGWTLANDSSFKLTYTKGTNFADDNKISDWAKDSVYFMSANGIINGVGDNKFAPKNSTTDEQAKGYANATREQALVIAVRMVKNLK